MTWWYYDERKLTGNGSKKEWTNQYELLGIAKSHAQQQIHLNKLQLHIWAQGASFVLLWRVGTEKACAGGELKLIRLNGQPASYSLTLLEARPGFYPHPEAAITLGFVIIKKSRSIDFRWREPMLSRVRYLPMYFSIFLRLHSRSLNNDHRNINFLIYVVTKITNSTFIININAYGFYW